MDTTLNIKFLTALNACDSAVQFVKRNNLESFPVSMLDQIQGDHEGWVKWIKNKLLNTELEFDSDGNLIYSKDSDGNEYWYEYDSNGNEIHYKNSDGYECWNEYDSNGNEIHYKNSDGYERFYPIEYYPSGQIKRYGNMILPNLYP